jgi:hypothetical protein
VTRGEQETVNNSQRKGSYSINVVQSVARKKEMVDYRVLRTNNPNIRIRGRILRMAPCKDRLWVRGHKGKSHRVAGENVVMPGSGGQGGAHSECEELMTRPGPGSGPRGLEMP